MALFGHFEEKYAHLGYFDPISLTFDKIWSPIPYEMWPGTQWWHFQILKTRQFGDMSS